MRSADPAAVPTPGADPAAVPRPPLPVKIVIAGGFGVGKTTAVAAISEIEPLTTEAPMTSMSVGVDDASLVQAKRTTTVAMDFGCITIERSLKLYLFGTPGQDRFGFLWDDLSEGAIGALVMVDVRRLDDCFPAIDYFERLGMPFVVGVNRFDGLLPYELEEIRWALSVPDGVPVVAFDARDRLSVRDVLLVVLDRALAKAMQGAPAPPGR